MQKKIIIGIGVLAVVLVTVSWMVSAPASQKIIDENVISKSGLHWHSELEIYVKGEKIEIPANIGLGATHNPIHTHDEDAPQGVVHMEFGGLVHKEDTKFGQFFKVWNKEIESFGANVNMTVNGVENIEYGNYEMKDGDKIKLVFE